MKDHDITEQAFKNGYVKGYSEGFNAGYTLSGWVSVDVELPSKDGKYLVCSNNNRWNKNNVYQARYYAGHGWGQKDKGKGITHWMPLPTPPKMKGAE